MAPEITEILVVKEPTGPASAGSFLIMAIFAIVCFVYLVYIRQKEIPNAFIPIYRSKANPWRCS